MICTECKRDLPPIKFHRDRVKGGRLRECVDCERAMLREIEESVRGCCRALVAAQMRAR